MKFLCRKIEVFFCASNPILSGEKAKIYLFFGTIVSLLSMTILPFYTASADQNDSFPSIYAQTPILVIDQNEKVGYDVYYNINGGTVKNATADFNNATLSINIESTADGSIEIHYPRNMLGVNPPYWNNYAQEPSVILVGNNGQVISKLEPIEYQFTVCEGNLFTNFTAATKRIDIIYNQNNSMNNIILSSNTTDDSTRLPSGYNVTSQVGFSDLFPNEGSITFLLPTMSNADRCLGPEYNMDTKQLHFHVEGPKRTDGNWDGERGYFEITIPHRMLGGNFTVLVNGIPVTNYNMTYNSLLSDKSGDSTTIAFNYNGTSAKSIDIYGTTAIPEFPMGSVAGIGVAFALIIIAMKIPRFFTRRIDTS